MSTEKDSLFLQQAIELARQGMDARKGGPFGCVIVRDGEVIGKGCNGVTSTNDPTAHAEIVAIRDACQRLGDYQLTGCTVYTSCEPCPMCLGALYWARPERIVYAATRREAADAGFDDDFIYREIGQPLEERKIPFVHEPTADAAELFARWKEKGDKQSY
jgi:guanine deaminase